MTSLIRFLLFTFFGTVPTLAGPFERLYVFGDSYSDFGAGYVDCDGPTAVAYFAWHMNLPVTHPKAANAAESSIVFAVSGAGTGSGGGRRVKDALLGYGMANQVNDFAARAKAGEIRFDPEATLFFFAGGLNDRMIETEVTLANLQQEIETLAALGARHFTVALLPTRIPNYSAVGQRLNPALIQLVGEMREKLGVSLWINHWGAYFDEVMERPASFGITDTTSKCAGRTINDEDPTPVGDPAVFFYYHNNHPSTAVYRIVGQKLFAEVLAHEEGRRSSGTKR